MRRRRTSPPDVSSVSRFHEALHHGQVEDARRMVHRDVSLATARSSSSPHSTSLMVCVTSRQASLKTTLALVKLMLAKGASLRTKDDRRFTVLMAACASGAHPNVVKCLLDGDRDSSNRGTPLWSDRDDQGRTALGLACLNGHGRLASFLLDMMDLEGRDKGQSHLYALSMTLKSGNERSAMELLRNRKLRYVVTQNREEEKLTVHGEWNQTRSQKNEDEEGTVASCVAKAVESNLVRIVQEMHRLNRRCVGHATWFALCSKRETCGRSKAAIVRRTHALPEFEEIADLHRRDCIWERMKMVFLIRFSSIKKNNLMEFHLVAELPDAVFRIVAEFLKPNFNDAEEAQKERFKAVLDLASW